VLGWDMDDAGRLLLSKRYDQSIDLNTKLNASLLTPNCRILVKIILHNVVPQGGHFDDVPQGGHFDDVKTDVTLLIYALVKKIKVNLAHAFVRNLMEGKSNMGYAMILTKIFKKVKIDVISKVPRKYKGGFDLITLTRMKLPQFLRMRSLYVG